jgi:hypothetical protein
VNCTVVHLQADNTSTTARAVYDQIEREVLYEEVGAMAQSLTVQSMKYGMSSSIGCGTRSLGDTLADLGRHTAERSLIDFPF